MKKYKLKTIYKLMYMVKLIFYKNKWPKEAAKIIANTVLSNQIINISFILIGISVDKIQGIEAEKNKMAATETTPITYFVSNEAPVTSKAGKNISAISIAHASAANKGSGIFIINVNG